MKNTLYYGDNLRILREHIATESVDLIYLDPPFNSQRTYNVLFKQESGPQIAMPPSSVTFRQAPRSEVRPVQPGLGLG